MVSVPALLVLLAMGFFQVGEPAGFSAIAGTSLLNLCAGAWCLHAAGLSQRKSLPEMAGKIP